MRIIFLNAFLVLSISAFGQTGKSNDTTFKLTDQIRNSLIKASKNHGKLDYWTSIKGHEFEGEKIEQDLYVSKGDAAIIKWSYDVTRSGLKNKADVIALYEDLMKRKISEKELGYIDYGFTKAIGNVKLSGE
jgi:hypothetical protein